MKDGQLDKGKKKVNSNALVNEFYEIGWVDPFPFEADGGKGKKETKEAELKR